jgi:hypothetical protein
VKRLAAVLLCGAAVAALPAGTAGAAGTYTSCSGGYDPDGTPGSFYRKIRAKRITCSAARVVVKAWVVKHKSGSSDPTKKVTISGYSCTGKSVSAPGDPNGGLEVLCQRDGGRKATRFFGHP